MKTLLLLCMALGALALCLNWLSHPMKFDQTPARRSKRLRSPRQSRLGYFGACFTAGCVYALTMPAKAWERINLGPMPQFANIGEGTRATGQYAKRSDGAQTLRFSLVKIGSDIDHVTPLTAATEMPLGVCTDEAGAAEDLVNVFVLGVSPGTVKMVANAAITAGATVFAAASGKVGAPATGICWKVGRALTAASADLDIIEVEHCIPIKCQPQELIVPVTLAQITGNIDVATAIPLSGARVLTKIDAMVQNVVTTGAKLATLSLKINAVAVTGGAVALTSANCTPLGAKVAGSAITALNVMAAGDTLSVVATGVTAFAEGAIYLVIQYIPVD